MERYINRLCRLSDTLDGVANDLSTDRTMMYAMRYRAEGVRLAIAEINAEAEGPDAEIERAQA